MLLNGEIQRSRRIVEGAADLLGLTHEQRQTTIPSGQEQWVNRGKWALAYLTRVGAVERTSRAHYRITEVGRKPWPTILLNDPHERPCRIEHMFDTISV